MSTITGFARIRNGAIELDGSLLFRSHSPTIEEFSMQAYTDLRLNYPKFFKMDHLSRMGFLAAEVLISKYRLTDYSAYDAALVLANANSSLDSDLKYLEASKKVSSPALFVYTLPNIVAGEICIRHTIKGENAFFVSSVFDVRFMYQYVTATMWDGVTKACVAGWVDVLKDQYDVLLYLVEENSRGMKLRHDEEEIKRLYEN